MTIGQLGHRPGLHVDVNLQGKVIDGQLFETEHWVSGVVGGLSELGGYVTVYLDEPLVPTEKSGLFHRAPKGGPRVSIDDPAHIRVKTMEEVAAPGAEDEVAELVRKGKTVAAIKRYREINGATLDEAKAYVMKLSS
jgi:hypothetical protein